MTYRRYNSHQKGHSIRMYNEAQQLNEPEWLATEKIHGANVSFYTMDNGDVQISSRSRKLNGEDVNRFMKNGGVLQEVADRIKTIAPAGHIFYGEVYGNPVNKYNYCDDVRVVIFDIYDTETKHYMSFDNMKFICDGLDLETPHVIFRGSFEDCMDQEREFMTYVGERRVKSEGFVVRRNSDKEYVGDEDYRLCFKVKAPEFAEQKFKAPKKPVKLAEDAQRLFDTVIQYVTEARVQAVASKDTYAKSEFNRFMMDARNDVIEDLIDDGVITDKDELKPINKPLGAELANTVRPTWLSMQD